MSPPRAVLLGWQRWRQGGRRGQKRTYPTFRLREQIKDLRNQCDGQPWDNDRIAKEEEIQRLELEYFRKTDELARKRAGVYASHAFWTIACLAVGFLFLQNS